MDTISHKYYVGEGNEAQAVIAEAKQLQNEHLDRIGAVLEKYGADCAWGPKRSPLCALGFKCERDSKPPMKENFLKPKVEKSGDEYYAVYYPDKRYRGGKQIKADLDHIGTFNFSDHVTRQLGVYRDCFGISNGGMVRTFSAAGQYGDRLVFRIPDSNDDRPREITIPAFLREVKESEFIAITKEGA